MENKYIFKLYVYGHSSECDLALYNLKNICKKHLNNNYEIQLIDIEEYPNQSEEARLIALPTLIKESPSPIRRIIGNLEDEEKVLLKLGLKF
ncbi:MAG: circadian clock KaiB family protein [bacterium]